MTLSRVVATPDEARAALAAPGDAVDLRAAADLDEAWAGVGFEQLVPGELVRPLDLELRSLDETHALGRRLAGELAAGDLVILTGPLGAGKTALTQGIGEGLGVRGAVTSPTFVLTRVHPGPVPLVHVDAYRLRESGRPVDLEDLGLDDDVPYSVTVVEWGEGLAEPLADARLHVMLSRGAGTSGTGTNGRTARIRAHGARWGVVHVP